MSFSRKVKRSKKKHKYIEPNYIESWQEWQDHQDVSGYYTGGRTPQFIFDKDASIYGLLLIVNGGITLLIGLFFCKSTSDPFIFKLLFMGLGALQFYAGIKRGFKRKAKAKKKS